MAAEDGASSLDTRWSAVVAVTSHGASSSLTAIVAVCAGWDAAQAQPSRTGQLSATTIASRDLNAIPKPSRSHSTSAPAVKRYKIRHDRDTALSGGCMARYGDKTTLILPDGQLGIPSMLVPTDQPFQPITAEELGKRLLNGPFKGYKLLKTDHYLILYQSTQAFAKNSGRLLDDLYEGLIEAFDRNGIPVHESEFPLVAVIFATERDFRAHKTVDPEVQAYYEFCTNRIFFYETPDQPHPEPKVAALLKPQTVAHEGAHQILSNIGVQPRLSNWPLWLVEGLAEYCATTAKTKKGLPGRTRHDQRLTHGDDP